MADGALVFSIARLTTPALELGLPDRFILQEDFVNDAQAPQHNTAQTQGSAAAEPAAEDGTSAAAVAALSPAGFASRVQADAWHPAGGTGGGLLKLPQAFGSVYLGQSFSAIVTACNFTSAPLAMVGIKVELSTERSRLALLYDSTGQPLPHLQPGQRHDFTVRHDVKDLGGHSLTCTATFLTPEGERRQQAQAFSFSAANPLVVRTKQRHVGEVVLLEAALENATREPMLLDTVAFLPSPPYMAQRIGGGGASNGSNGSSGSDGSSGSVAEGAADCATRATAGGPLSSYIQSLPLMPVGGSLAFLFRLTKPAAAAAAAAGAASAGPADGAAGGPADGPSAAAASAAAAAAAAAAGLGKIEIRWRGPMAQMARLQTQLISLPPQQGPREASLALACLPARVAVGLPFTATLKVCSHVDRWLGPLKVAAAATSAAAELAKLPAGTPPRLSRPSGSPADPPGASISRETSSSLYATAGSASSTPLGTAASPAAAAAVRRPSAGGGGSAPGSPTAALAAAVAAGAAGAAVCLDGPAEVALAELAPRGEAEVQLRLLALAAGQQALPALALVGERDGRQYAFLPPAELFVDSTP